MALRPEALSAYLCSTMKAYSYVHPHSRLLGLLVVQLLLMVRLCDAQNVRSAPFAVGETTVDIASSSDSNYRYALYLPTTYSDDRTAPAMFLMDPRGRALVPLELFRDAAERHGFVLLSSYNTLSDTDSAFAVNGRALSAMLLDSKTRLSVDPRRVYLVGFSGTAHYAWHVAPQLDGKLAGIMGVGGGLPAYSDPIQRALTAIYPFAFFGTAGMADFNFDGVRYLDQSLDATQFAHRLMTHEGDHSWPPKEIAEAAVEWFHLRAMSSGLIPPDPVFIADAFDRHMDEAASLESSGRKADAFRRYREIVQDFEPLGGAPDARKRLESLENDRAVRRTLKQRDEFMERVIEYKLQVRDFYLEYRETDELPELEKILKKLRIPKLLEQTEDDDLERASAAKRMLATAFVNTSFYEPRDYFKRKDYRRAAGLLRIADFIHPGAPRVCYQLARAAAQLGQLEEAMEALECGIKAEWATRELVEGDSLLEPLRSEFGYREILESGEVGN